MSDAQDPGRLIEQAIRSVIGRDAADRSFVVEKPENPAHGDYATNVALKLAPKYRKLPIVLAEEIAQRLQRNRLLARVAERISVAPPGFINVVLSTPWLSAQASAIAVSGKNFGRALRRRNEKVQVEFISANPTGPLTLANGRGGFLGDVLANTLEAAGFSVVREYYVNDAGAQVRKLGWSVLRASGYTTPFDDEELYPGAYVAELARAIGVPAGEGRVADDRLAGTVARASVKIILSGIKRTTRRAGIHFDVWFSERSLRRQGFVDEVLGMLKRKRLLEEREGAVWLRAQELGETQDRVLVKSNGEPTYLLPDLAYHYEKFMRRKFSRVIDVFGADHHGNARALQAGLRALGLPEPDVVLIQFVRLVAEGQEVRMSKRGGTFIELTELLDAVGTDVARWFFLERAAQTHMDFDLQLAKDHSENNPVFYVQYAHARCASILRKAGEGGASRKKTLSLTHPSETALVRELIRLPGIVTRIAQTYEVHHLTAYATAVAAAFSVFYRDCPVLTSDDRKREDRLVLVVATKTVLANTLALLGIRAPERM